MPNISMIKKLANNYAQDNIKKKNLNLTTRKIKLEVSLLL